MYGDIQRSADISPCYHGLWEPDVPNCPAPATYEHCSSGKFCEVHAPEGAYPIPQENRRRSSEP